MRMHGHPLLSFKLVVELVLRPRQAVLEDGLRHVIDSAEPQEELTEGAVADVAFRVDEFEGIVRVPLGRLQERRPVLARAVGVLVLGCIDTLGANLVTLVLLLPARIIQHLPHHFVRHVARKRRCIVARRGRQHRPGGAAPSSSASARWRSDGFTFTFAGHFVFFLAGELSQGDRLGPIAALAAFGRHKGHATRHGATVMQSRCGVPVTLSVIPVTVSPATVL